MTELRFIQAGDIPFTGRNPATDAYQRSEQIAQQQLLAQQQQDQVQRQNTIQTATLPNQLRRMTADTNMAETNAGVATATAPARISEANSAATTAGVNARFAAPEAQARLRQQNASAKSAEMAGFYKSLELLNQGDVAGATEVARQTGHTLPPQVVQNAELRNFVTSIAKRAQELYKDRADLQQQFIQSKMEAHAAQVQPGGQPQPGQPQPNQPQQPAQQSNPITDPYTMPPGAPAIPETSGVHNFEVVNRQETDAEGKPVVKSYRFDKRSGQMTPIEGDGVVLPRNSAGGAGAGGGLTPEAINGAAERVLNGDPKALQNIGRGAQGAAALTAINNRVYELAKERGVSAQQIGTQVAAFAGQQAAMRTLGTKGANIEYAANTASRAIDFAQEAMSKVPRSQFLPFGKLQQIIDTQTNSPEQAAAFTATNTLVNEYARVVSPTGQPTEGTRQHAREMLNTAQSHDAFNATLAMMRREIASAKAAFDQTRQEFLARGGPSPTPALTGSPDHSSLSDDDLKLKLGL